MDKIVVKNSCIVINNYDFGDCPKLENFFAIYNPVFHTKTYIGIYYDKENRQLYLPRGIDIWYLENIFNEKAHVEKNQFFPYDTYDDIKVNSLPRDNDQREAIRFAVGAGEYLPTLSKSQLCINLNTGKGKTYVSIGTMSIFGIKSMIITYSKSILIQWGNEIMKYTNITKDEICLIDGSGVIFRLLTKKDIYKYKIFLVTHSTLKSYGDTYGWDKITELFQFLRVGLKFYDEAHLNFENMCMIDFFTSVYKSYYLTASPNRSQDDEDRIYQTSFKNVLAIDLFHPETDPHTHYRVFRYNSRPEPQVISFCRNSYGLDRNKYTNYIVGNTNFRMMTVFIMDFIFKNICTHYYDKLLIYIGTNQAIMEFHDWIIQIFPFLRGQIGIFTSIVSDEEKLRALDCRVILTTTRSAGAAIDIKNLKCTWVLAEPFKSKVLAKQTLGRTRGNNTYYIESVDKGFRQCTKYFLDKRETFRTYALDCKVYDIQDQEMIDTYDMITQRFTNPIKPFIVQPPMIKPFTVNP